MNKPFIQMQNLTSQESNAVVLQHGRKLPNGQVFITRPLKVFKKVYVESSNGYYSTRQDDAVANLIIPKGAIVNLARQGSKKMRASVAICHSIVRCSDNKEFNKAISKHRKQFKYRSLKAEDRAGALILANSYENNSFGSWSEIPKYAICRPKEPFSMAGEECASGIHFFVDSNAALYY